MYCSKCNTLIENETTICPKCHFDNSENLDETTEIYLEKIVKNTEPVIVKKNRIKVVSILVLVLIIFVIFFYVIKDSTLVTDNVKPEVTTQKIILLNKTFKLKNIKMMYSEENYGTSTNTIFNKHDNKFNINVSLIDEQTYNEYLNSEDILDSKLGNIETKTFAEDSSYSHIFKLLDDYYLIKVNYSNDNQADSLNIQTELSKTINTLEQK